MKKIAIFIILAVVFGSYFLIFSQNNISTCVSTKSQLSSLVKNILGQEDSQKSITYEITDIKQTKAYEHSRICKAKLNFKDGTNTTISYAVENNKLGKTAVRIVPGG